MFLSLHPAPYAACISVDGQPERCAREFQKLFFSTGDNAATNCFIDNQEDFPTFPAQLGCQGFIVLDHRSHFVTLRSMPVFLEARGGAFRAVERLLAPLIEAAKKSSTAAAPREGRAVVLTNLGNAELNGARAVELPDEEAPPGRVAVRLGDGRVVAVKTTNLLAADADADADAARDAAAGAGGDAASPVGNKRARAAGGTAGATAVFSENACSDAPAELGKAVQVDIRLTLG